MNVQITFTCDQKYKIQHGIGSMCVHFIYVCVNARARERDVKRECEKVCEIKYLSLAIARQLSLEERASQLHPFDLTENTIYPELWSGGHVLYAVG